VARQPEATAKAVLRCLDPAERLNASGVPAVRAELSRIQAIAAQETG